MGVLSCSRVIMRTALALVVLLAVTVSGGRHHKNRNKGNKGEGRARCGVQQYTVQEKTYKQECHNEYENRCATSYANKCSTVTEVTTEYENVCSTSYVESCATVTEVTKECHTASLHSIHSYGHAGHGYGHYTAPVRKCVAVPVHNKVCTKEPVESCKKVPKEIPVAREVCNKEPVQSCNQVPKEVPVSKEVCTKKPVQSCSQVPTKFCRNVAVSVPRTVARRVCRH